MKFVTRFPLLLILEQVFPWLNSFSTNFLGHRFNLNFLLLLNCNLFLGDWFNLFTLNLFDYHNWFNLFNSFLFLNWLSRLSFLSFVFRWLLGLCGFSHCLLWFSFVIQKTLLGNCLPNSRIFGLLFLIWVQVTTIQFFTLLICDGGFKDIVHKLIFANLSLNLLFNFWRLRNWYLFHSLRFLFRLLLNLNSLFLLLFGLRSCLWFRLFFTTCFGFLSETRILLF